MPVDQKDEDTLTTEQKTPKKLVKRKSKALRTSPRLETTKVSKPIVLKDNDVNEDDDDAKSDHADETVVNDTGKQVGTYN